MRRREERYESGEGDEDMPAMHISSSALPPSSYPVFSQAPHLLCWPHVPDEPNRNPPMYTCMWVRDVCMYVCMYVCI